MTLTLKVIGWKIKLYKKMALSLKISLKITQRMTLTLNMTTPTNLFLGASLVSHLGPFFISGTNIIYNEWVELSA